MEVIYPKKIKSGDQIRVVAPSQSFSIISSNLREIAKSRFNELGLNVSFGRHIEESDTAFSSSIESRVADLHEAFQDPEISAILTVIGGFNSNQLLNYLDWDIIRKNPKVFCGFSDITALNNAIFSKTGLVTYSGPHYSTFGQSLYFDYTLEYFKKCLLKEDEFSVLPSKGWSDDEWWKKQEERKLINNDGFWVVNEGRAVGTILGGNLGTFSLLQGTDFFPNLDNSIIFIEDDAGANDYLFDRVLQSLIQQSSFAKVVGLVIGRFQNSSNISKDKLIKIIKSKKELNRLPILANVDFGHTDPKITFPVGGTARLEVERKVIIFDILKH